MSKTMTRRAFLSAALAGGAGLALYGLSTRARSTNIDTSLAARLEQSVIVPLTPPFINTYLVWGQKPMLVDTGNPGEANAILSALRAWGVEPKTISLILLTHGHIDHIGSAFELRKETGAPVAIHHNDVNALRTGETPPVQPSGTLLGNVIYRTLRPRTFTTFEPDVVLEGDEGSLEDFGIEARWLRTPGHTEGSLSLLTKTGAVVGDLLSGNFFIRHAPDYPFFVPRDVPRKTSLQTIEGQVSKLLDENIERFYVGHGYDFDKKSLRRRFHVYKAMASRKILCNDRAPLNSLGIITLTRASPQVSCVV